MSALVTNNTFAQTRKNLAETRERDDFYRTPPSAVSALLAVETFSPIVWEPACGDGAISNVLIDAGYKVVSTDLVDRGYGIPKRDFLLERNLLAPSVITNPPFKLADEFALFALGLGAEKVALLCRLAWLEGGKRHKELWSRRPPARIWVFCRRQTLWRGDDPNAKDQGGAIAFAWFVWDVGHTGSPALGWLPTAPRSGSKR